MKDLSQKNIFFPLLFLVLAFFLVVFFGYGETDQEFINSLAHRVSLGDLPYRDFDYVRPPLSLYLHSISFILFPDYAVIFSRIIYFFQMLLIAYLSTIILYRLNYFSSLKIIPYTLIFFLLSLHNFPTMPWHTVDGLMFLILASYFLMDGISKNKIIYFILAGICCGLASLAKQNFLLLSPFFLLITLILHRKNFFYVLLGQVICGLVFLLYLNQNELLSVFLDNQSSESTFFSIFYSIVISFQLHDNLSVFPSIIVLGIGILLNKIGFIKKNKAIIIPMLFFVFLSIAELYISNWDFYDSYTANPKIIYQVIWISSIYFFLINKNQLSDFLNPENLILILLFVIGISSMISWGYPYPNLFVAPYLAILFREFEKYFGEIDSNKILLFSFVAWLLISNLQYRDDYKILSNNNLGNLYPRLNLLNVGESNFSSYQNLKDLSGNFDVVTVIPDFPLFSYLNNSKSDFRIDWFLDSESTSSIKKYLESMEGRYFIVMDKCYEDRRQPKRIALCNIIKNNSTLIREIDDLKLYKYK